MTLPPAPDQFPRGTEMPSPTDLVQIIMPESHARNFEKGLRGRAHLGGPVLFSEDDLPTYTIVPGPRP